MRVVDGTYNETCTCGAINTKAKGLGESKRHADDCPWGTWVQFSDVEKQVVAEDIYNRNSKAVRGVINKEQSRISKDGIIEEQRLRDEKTRQILGLNNAKKK
jgi:hypothetical protein